MKMYKNRDGSIVQISFLLLVLLLSGCGNTDYSGRDRISVPTIKESAATPESTPTASVSDAEPGRCDGSPGGDPECITKPTHIRLDDAFPGLAYWNAHGTTSPDQTEVLISATETLGINTAVAPVLPGVILYSVLDARALEKGHIRIKRTGYSTSMPGMGYALAPRWSHDGKMIAVAAHDRLYVINSEDLSPLNGPFGVQLQYAGTDVETHYAIFTADDQYIILNVRFVRNGLTTMDSGLQLYSVAEQRLVGLPSSTCDACHRKTAPDVMNAESCSMDGIVNPVETPSFKTQNFNGDGPTGGGLTSRSPLDLESLLGGAGTQQHGYGDVSSMQNPLGPVYDLVNSLLPSDLLRALPLPMPWLDINAYLSQYAHAGLDNLMGGISIPTSPLAAVLTMIPQIAISDIADPISILQGLPIVGPLVSGGGLPFLGAFPGDSGADSAYAYAGRVILGGYSGHFAVADIAIDPRQPSPITVTALNRAVVRTGVMMHGASIDSRNSDIVYWAGNKLDDNALNHYGSFNLKTGEVVDKTIDYPFVGIPPALPYQEWFYCASLQTAGYMMPVSMTMPGYVTVIPKCTIK